MKFEELTPELLFELSKEVLTEYPVNHSDLPVDQNEYLKLVCIELLDRYSSLNEEERQIAMISSNIALVLENFLLNLKLLKQKDGRV